MTLDQFFLGSSVMRSTIQAALTAQGYTAARTASLDHLAGSSEGLAAIKTAVGTPQQAGTAYNALLNTANVAGSVPVVLANATHGGAGATIAANLAGNLAGSVTGNLSGSVGSVTGSVGSVAGNVAGSVASVTGSVASVAGNVGGSVAGSAGSVAGAVTVSTSNDKSGYTLGDSYDPLKTAIQTGDVIDLVDAPATAAIRAGLATPASVWSYSERLVQGPVITATGASPSPATGTTTTLSVTATAEDGESTLSYTWSATGVPTGATAPTFSPNGTNAAKNTTVTFYKAGAYEFTVAIIDLDGLTATSSVSVVVEQTVSTIAISPWCFAIGSDGTRQFDTTMTDQFGDAMAATPTVTWTTTAGTIASDGFLTAPTVFSNLVVTATNGAATGAAYGVTVNLSADSDGDGSIIPEADDLVEDLLPVCLVVGSSELSPVAISPLDFTPVAAGHIACKLTANGDVKVYADANGAETLISASGGSYTWDPYSQTIPEMVYVGATAAGSASLGWSVEVDSTVTAPQGNLVGNTAGQALSGEFSIGTGGTYSVPAGATTLYLGFHDFVNWTDNWGAASVQLTWTKEDGTASSGFTVPAKACLFFAFSPDGAAGPCGESAGANRPVEVSVPRGATSVAISASGSWGCASDDSSGPGGRGEHDVTQPGYMTEALKSSTIGTCDTNLSSLSGFWCLRNVADAELPLEGADGDQGHPPQDPPEDPEKRNDPSPPCNGGCPCANGTPKEGYLQTGFGGQGLSPGYASGQNPHPIIAVDHTITADKALPDHIVASIYFGGACLPKAGRPDSPTCLQTVYYDPAGFSPGDSVRIALQIDATDMPTGQYNYILVVKEHRNAGIATSNVYRGTKTIVNRRESALGNRWSFWDLDQLAIMPLAVMLIRGQESAGSVRLSKLGSATFNGNTLTNTVDGYTLTLREGGSEEFNLAGLLTARTDAKGNRTTYTYTKTEAAPSPSPLGSGVASILIPEDPGLYKLVSMTDPLGHTTTLTYSGNLVQTITDHAGRTVTLGYADGCLTSVTLDDPDGAGSGAAPVWTYTYDDNGLMTSVTNPNGATIQYAYNFAHMLVQETYPNSATRTLAPADLVGLVDLSVTGYDADHLAPMAASSAVKAVRVDQYGETTSTATDGYGLPTSETDALGNTTTYARDAAGRVTLVTEPDPDGAGTLGQLVTQYTYDASGNCTAATYAVGTADEASESWTYDGAWNVPTRHVDELGRVTNFAIDPATGLVASATRVASAGNVSTSYTYTDGTGVYAAVPKGLVLTKTDPLGSVTTYNYGVTPSIGSFGKVTAVTLATGTSLEATVSLEYDQAGNVSAVVDELGRRTEYGYDQLDRLVTKTQADPAGPGSLVTSYQYDGLGNRTRVTDPLGNVAQAEYCPLDSAIARTVLPDPDGAGPQSGPQTVFGRDVGMRLTNVLDALGRTTWYTYDELGRVATVTENYVDGLYDPDAPDEDVITTFTYYVNGKLRTKTDVLGNLTEYLYDARGRLLSVIAPDPDGAGSGTSPVTSYTYDDAGQLLTVTDPQSRTTTYAYDELGRRTSVTDPLSHTTSFTYDAVGNVLTRTDALNHTTSYSYDARNRRTSQTDAEGNVTSFTYDAVGNLLTLTDPNDNVTTWTYDSLNRVSTETNPLGATRYYTYNGVGRLVRATDRNGRVVTYSYDNLYRKTAENWLDSGGNVSATISYSYDALGHLLTAADPATAVTYTYDALGRVASRTETRSGLTPTIVLNYSYNALGQCTAVTSTIGGTTDAVTEYTYDHLGRVTSLQQHGVTGGNAVAEKRVDFTYDAASHYATLTQYADLAGTHLVYTSTYTFDVASRLTGLNYLKDQTTLASYAYTFAAANEIASMTTVDGTVNYTYDATDQLLTAGTATYTYDDAGNRTAWNNTSYTISSDNRLASDATFTYTHDAEGNRLTRTRLSSNAAADYLTEYTWDHRNRLAGVTFKNSDDEVIKTVAHTYDYANRWIGETILVPGENGGTTTQTRYVYDGNQIVAQFDKTGTGDLASTDLTHRYLWDSQAVDHLFADEQVTSLNNPGSVLYTLTDHENSIRDLVTYNAGTDTTTVANHRVYDVYGNLDSQTNAAVDCLFGYTGRPYSQATGLQNNTNRWYEAITGRWLSQDPIGFGGGDANLYRYCGNSPLEYVDPKGLADWEVDGETTTLTLHSTTSGADIPIKVPVGQQNRMTIAKQVLSFAKNDQQRRELKKALSMIWGMTDPPFNWNLDGRCHRWVQELLRRLQDANVNLTYRYINPKYIGPIPWFSDHALVEFTVNGNVFYVDRFMNGGYEHIAFQLRSDLVDENSPEYKKWAKQQADSAETLMLSPF